MHAVTKFQQSQGLHVDSVAGPISQMRQLHNCKNSASYSAAGDAPKVIAEFFKIKLPSGTKIRFNMLKATSLNGSSQHQCAIVLA